MADKKYTPNVDTLYALFPSTALSMARIAIIDQIQPLGIEYKVIRRRQGIEIEIPTTSNGLLRITATEKGPGEFYTFFKSAPEMKMRLPGGKVIKSEAKEEIHATVEYISGCEHEDVTYLLKEPNFAEVIDTAIESLAQIDKIRVFPLERNRRPRRSHPYQPELGEE